MKVQTLKILAIIGFHLIASAKTDFYAEREDMLKKESQGYLGSDLNLTSEEETVNTILMMLKRQELDKGFQDSFYPPSQSLFKTLQQIESSEVFQFLREMPKGGILHIHELSMASADWMVSDLTYREDLWMCIGSTSMRFGWFSREPNSIEKPCESGSWRRVQEMRMEFGAESIDQIIYDYLTINVPNPAEVYPDINAVWRSFQDALGVTESLLSYEPVFYDMLIRAFTEYKEDNVQFVEIRSVLPETICTSKDPENCGALSALELAGVFNRASEDFKTNNEDFCGAKLIYAPIRSVSNQRLAEYFDLAAQLKSEYPDFMMGFDLVGQEDMGRPLIDFADQLIEFSKTRPDIPFFFHAGETNWQGVSTDINIVDAILLNTTRIGHGYAIVKHPEAKVLAREKDIPLEICPVSNQVLGLVNDVRNHPGSVLIQEGFPLVISSDDPGAWGTKALSYDFYEAFMAMASRDMDLHLLKKLVENSVKYAKFSNTEEKNRCEQIVSDQWKNFFLRKSADRDFLNRKSQKISLQDEIEIFTNEIVIEY